MLWHFELKFCIWLCFTVLQIKFECRQFPSIFVGVMPLLELRILEIHSFLHFSPLTYWAETLHMTLFNVLKIKFECHNSVAVWLFVLPSIFCTFLLHALTYLAENLNWRSLGFFNAFLLEKYYIKIAFSSIMHRLWCSGIFIIIIKTGSIMVWWCPSVRVSVRPSVRLSVRPSGSLSPRFPHFSHTCFDILSWNFAHDFVLMYYRSSLSVITLHQFLKELCLFVNLEYR